MSEMEKVELVYDPSIAEEYRKEHPELYAKAVPVEIEGGGYNWWYVCGECHGQVNTGDRACGHCESTLRWDEAVLKESKKGKMHAEDFETAYFAGYEDGYKQAIKDMAKHMKEMKTYGGYKNQHAEGLPGVSKGNVKPVQREL